MEFTGDTSTDPSPRAARRGGGGGAQSRGATRASPSLSSRGSRRQHSGWDVPPIHGVGGGHPSSAAANASGAGALARNGGAQAPKRWAVVSMSATAATTF